MFSYRVLFVGLAVGLLFAIMDALINANPIAQRLYSVYQPIARKSVNAPLGLAFDLVSGIVMAFLFVTFRSSLPGGPFAKGAAFGLTAWFFRVAMGSASQLVVFQIPSSTVLYGFLTGMVEMATLGVVCGLLLGSR